MSIYPEKNELILRFSSEASTHGFAFSTSPVSFPSNRDSVSATPVMVVAGQRGEEVPLDLDNLNFSGPPHLGLETGREDKPSYPFHMWHVWLTVASTDGEK